MVYHFGELFSEIAEFVLLSLEFPIYNVSISVVVPLDHVFFLAVRVFYCRTGLLFILVFEAEQRRFAGRSFGLAPGVTRVRNGFVTSILDLAHLVRKIGSLLLLSLALLFLDLLYFELLNKFLDHLLVTLFNPVHMNRLLNRGAKVALSQQFLQQLLVPGPLAPCLRVQVVVHGVV